MSNTKRYVEITPEPYHGKGKSLKFVPVNQIHLHTGFRSICQYTEEQVNEAYSAGTIKALEDTEVLCDQMFLDFDNSPLNALIFEAWCQDNCYQYEKYDSGSRSIHFHVDIVTIDARCAPASIKAFLIKEFGEGFCDISFYHYAGLYRLPGTVHKKTGRKKELISTGGFFALDIPLIEKTKFGQLNLDICNFEWALINYINYIKAPPTEGNRSLTLWRTAKMFAESEVSYPVAEELITIMNNSWGRMSKPQQKVDSQVSFAYK